MSARIPRTEARPTGRARPRGGPPAVIGACPEPALGAGGLAADCAAIYGLLVADRDWVPDFRALAARRARLLGVSGEFYDHRNSAENEPDWPGSWLRAIVATEDLMHQN